ncbi:outer membrane protein assembly factor BamC [Aurantivibrio plasticivorans]
MKYLVSKTVGVTWLVLSLSGCGVLFGDDGLFPDKSDDYLDAESIPPMKLPEDADQERFTQLYEVPALNNADWEYPDSFRVPRPQPLSANVFSEKVKIQSLSNKRWIAINTPPAELWPRVRSFLANNNLQVSRTNPEVGLIETSWLSFKDDPDHRDRYQIRVEQGVQPESSEIHVLHIQLPRADELPADILWPDVSSSPEREAWLVDELAATLASEVNSASASLLAQTIGGDEKVFFDTKNKEPILRLELVPERAWATLTYAVKQEGLRLIELDRKSNIVYVTYTSPDESEGFFSGWFSDEEDEVEYSLTEIIEHLNIQDTPQNRALFPPAAFADAKSLADLPGYLLLVVEHSDSIEVYVRNAYGRPLVARDARELLGIIKRNLI